MSNTTYSENDCAGTKEEYIVQVRCARGRSGAEYIDFVARIRFFTRRIIWKKSEYRFIRKPDKKKLALQ